MFTIQSKFPATVDQENVVKQLSEGVLEGKKNQVLLGVTGSGKTFTMAQIIERLQMPALIISHNKTLAGQLYQETRDFLPENGISYFVSYYDYYQPEAYLPQSDTYIEKEAQINEQIDKLRLRSTTNLLTRRDVAVVASVSCIYNIGSPLEYGKFVLQMGIGEAINFQHIFLRLIELQYERNEFDFHRGTFRVRGNKLDIYPAYEDFGFRLSVEYDKLTHIQKFDPLTGEILGKEVMDSVIIYPAKQYLTDRDTFADAEAQIRHDLELEHAAFIKQNKLVEAQRLLKKVNYDLEMIKEVGYVNGIENYSRYFDKRPIGGKPYSLIDYFNHRFGDKWVAIVDESHMTIPQIRGMYNGDFARKKTLIDFGFRMQAAYDNRPLKWVEFYNSIPHFIHVSATPAEWEIEASGNKVVELLVRPTGILDPKITIKKAENEIPDLLVEIEKRVSKGQRVLVTTLTKRTAEDLCKFLQEKKINAEYLHSDIKTLERLEILNKLRKGEFDVLVGINLLREGLDLPEVTLVAILEADKEGFLRSRTSLIQTMGRAARNTEGEVILYADTITNSIREAISEVERRKEYQMEYNKKFGITPYNVAKDIKDKIVETEDTSNMQDTINLKPLENLKKIKTENLTPYDKQKLIKKLDREMKKLAEDLEFEMAIAVREKIEELKA
jgi:excinuclease ABC subunit B